MIVTTQSSFCWSRVSNPVPQARNFGCLSFLLSLVLESLKHSSNSPHIIWAGKILQHWFHIQGFSKSEDSNSVVSL